MDIRDAWESQRKHDANFEANNLVTPAEIISIGGSVDVSGRPGFIWVREYSQGGGVFQAFNPHVQAREELPVLVGYEPKAPWRRVILDPDWSLIVEASTYDGDPYLPSHSVAHEWPDGNPGGDVVDVHMRAMVPLRTYASTALTVNVAPCRYHYNNTITSFPGKTGYDISAHKPASGLALYVLVYLDMATNTISSTAGATIVDNWGIPTPPSVPAGAISSALIRLDGDQTTIVEGDIVDVRTMWGEGGIIVHTHASNAQGGQLDWDDVWVDAVHDHSAAGEGGTHWGGITQTFGGASAANIVTVPDNVAQALNLVDAGTLEYMRIVSTDAQPAVVFNEGGADIDFRIEGTGAANALIVDGATGRIGLNATGGTTAGVNANYTSSMVTGDIRYGILIQHTAAPTEDLASGAAYGMAFFAYTSAATAWNHNYLAGVIGSAQHRGGGVLSLLRGADVALQLHNAGGSVTTAANFMARAPVRVSGDKTIGTLYGAYIEAQSAAFVTTGYGIYCAGASDSNYFAGKVGFGAAVPGSVTEWNFATADLEFVNATTVDPGAAADTNAGWIQIEIAGGTYYLRAYN